MDRLLSSPQAPPGPSTTRPKIARPEPAKTVWVPRHKSTKPCSFLGAGRLLRAYVDETPISGSKSGMNRMGPCASCGLAGLCSGQPARSDLTTNICESNPPPARQQILSRIGAAPSPTRTVPLGASSNALPTPTPTNAPTSPTIPHSDLQFADRKVKGPTPFRPPAATHLPLSWRWRSSTSTATWSSPRRRPTFHSHGGAGVAQVAHPKTDRLLSSLQAPGPSTARPKIARPKPAKTMWVPRHKSTKPCSFLGAGRLLRAYVDETPDFGVKVRDEPNWALRIVRIGGVV